MCAFYDSVIVVVSHNERAIAKESLLSHYYCRFLRSKMAPKSSIAHGVSCWLLRLDVQDETR